MSRAYVLAEDPCSMRHFTEVLTFQTVSKSFINYYLPILYKTLISLTIMHEVSDLAMLAFDPDVQIPGTVG